jgi:sulfur relay (sulfurtransferase) DsrF/TusC family protein
MKHIEEYKQMSDTDPYLLKEIDESTKDTNGYFWGIMHKEDNTFVMYIADKNFNIIESVEPAFIKGKYSKNSIDLLKRYSIEDHCRMRTEKSIRHLKNNLKLTASLTKMYENRKGI